MIRLLSFLLGLSALLCLTSPVEAQIGWESTFEAATTRAKQEGRLVFVAVNMDGEGANDHLAEQVYRDKRVLELTASTVNVVASRFEHSSGSACKRFAGIACSDHKRVEVDIRGVLIKEDESGFVIAPQHLLLAPDGTVILSVPYAITAEELIWCLVTALNTRAGAEPLPLPEEATPPRRLIMSGVHEPKGGVVFVRPLTEDELEASIKEMKKGWGAIEDMRRFYQILATDSPDAVKFATLEIDSGIISWGPDMTCSLVNSIARYSPPSFWPVAVSCLDNRDESVRGEAAAALEQLGHKKSLSPVKRAYSKERSADVKCALLRAMGAAGAGNAGVARTLVSTASSESDMGLRLNAVLALAYHPERKDVRELLGECLQDEDARVRQAAALAIAFARLSEFTAALTAAAEAEQDEQAAALQARALEVLAGGNLGKLALDYQRIGGDRVRRVRFFGDG